MRIRKAQARSLKRGGTNGGGREKDEAERGREGKRRRGEGGGREKDEGGRGREGKGRRREREKDVRGGGASDGH